MKYHPDNLDNGIPEIQGQQRQNQPPLPNPADTPMNNNTGQIKRNPWLEMAYGGSRTVANQADIETRIQRLERGQKVVRRGRVMPATPQFRTQSIISQTSANNQFTANTIKGITYPPGTMPDVVTPTTNSSINYPRVIDQA